MRNYYYSLRQGEEKKGFAIAYGCGGLNILPLYYETIEFYCEPEDINGIYEVWLIGWAGGELEKDLLCKKGLVSFSYGCLFLKEENKIILNDVWFGNGEYHYICLNKNNEYVFEHKRFLE